MLILIFYYLKYLIDAVNAVCVCVLRDDGAVGAGGEVIYMWVPEAPRQPRQYVQH